jgi:hypothetical protein
MAIVKRVTRVSNPRRKPAHKRKRNARRRMTAKQIKHFGTKAQKAALKRRKRTVGGTVRRRKQRNVRKARRRSHNPALVVTLGAVNPKRRKRSMARKARKQNKRRVTRRRKSRNPVVRGRAKVTRHRRGIRRRRVHNRRRNPMPSFFGAVGPKGLATTIAGGLVGVAAAKFIPTLIPAGMLPVGGGVIMRTVITGAAAWLAGMATGRFVGKAFGDAVLFGGLMQTGSVALNALLPGFAIGGVPLGLSGMGELMDGRFSVPQNPIRGALPAATPAQVRATMNGLDRAYGRAF